MKNNYLHSVLAITFSVASFAFGTSLVFGDKPQPENFRRPSQSPNVIIMMADDMGLGDTSAYQDWTGNQDAVQVKTPAMERLARIGIRFTDAHSPSSRCTATRQALLTGRYTWRTRLKQSVLWGPQGDPLIEPGRPTLATLLRDADYHTGMSGKWHCGLTYRNARGEPESDWNQVDLTKGIADGPINHGFDFFHGTSRSHPTSKDQGWLKNDKILAATGGLNVDRSQYVLKETGVVNFERAQEFLKSHVKDSSTRAKPFFLYYACHSNHTSHDPCKEISGRAVRGASNLKTRRSDFIYENDVVLSLLLDWLESADDPRRPGHPLLENTLVIFTSDNGAENKSKSATGPLRSKKGSIYEGGHRVPFIAAWKIGGIGGGLSNQSGQTSDFPICHVDLFATLAEIIGIEVSQGAEDSISILGALGNKPPQTRTPLIHNDHNEGAQAAGVKPKQKEAAWMAIRVDNPSVDGKLFEGKWKLLVDHELLYGGIVNPKELYELDSDQKESTNRVAEPDLKPLVKFLAQRLKSIHDGGRIVSE
jgi:arylsulfatase A-like enzyme